MSNHKWRIGDTSRLTAELAIKIVEERLDGLSSRQICDKLRAEDGERFNPHDVTWWRKKGTTVVINGEDVPFVELYDAAFDGYAEYEEDEIVRIADVAAKADCKVGPAAIRNQINARMWRLDRKSPRLVQHSGSIDGVPAATFVVPDNGRVTEE